MRLCNSALLRSPSDSGVGPHGLRPVKVVAWKARNNPKNLERTNGRATQTLYGSLTRRLLRRAVLLNADSVEGRFVWTVCALSIATGVSQAPAFYYDLLLSPLRNAQTCVASCLVPVRRATIVALRVPMWSSQSLCGCEPFSSWASSIRADPIPSFLSALGAKRTSPACRTPCTPAFLVRKGSIYVLTRERGRRYSWLAGWLEELRLGLLATSTLYIEHPGYPSSVPRPLLDPVKRDSRVRALRLIVNAHSERDREQAATASAARSARCAGRPQPPDVTPSGVACATSCPGPARSSLKAVMCRVASTESRQTGAVVYVVPRPSRVTARVYDINKLHAHCSVRFPESWIRA